MIGYGIPESMADERGFVFHGPDGQVELSIDEVKGLADRNDPDGLYALAMAYLFGWDVEQNEDVGYDLLEKAVAAGQTEAMALMVRLFMQGDYCGIDSEKAAGYAIEAARGGIPDAQLYAGLAYMDGVSVSQDYAKAARLFRLAANQGNQEARTSLAYLFQEGLGVAKDERKAYRMYCTAAKAGNVNAMFQAGICCEFGNGTPVDPHEAERWYRMGAEQGDAFAMERLGYLLSESDPPRAEESFEWFLKAAMEGVPTAMQMVGYCYMKGIGTPRDDEEARKWLRMAGDNGIEEAAEMLASIGSVLG